MSPTHKTTIRLAGVAAASVLVLPTFLRRTRRDASTDSNPLRLDQSVSGLSIEQALQLSSQAIQDLTARAAAILLLNIALGAGVATSLLAIWNEVDHSLLISLVPAALSALIGILQCLRALYPIESEDLNLSRRDDLTQDALESRLLRASQRSSIIAGRLRGSINEVAIGLSATIVLLVYQLGAYATSDLLLNGHNIVQLVNISTVTIATLAILARVLDAPDRHWPAVLGAWIAWTPRLTSSLLVQSYTPVFFVTTLLNLTGWLTIVVTTRPIFTQPHIPYLLAQNVVAVLATTGLTYGFIRFGYRPYRSSTSRFVSTTALLVLEVAALLTAWFVFRRSDSLK